MDARSRTPKTRLELAESIATGGELSRRLEAHARLRFRLPASDAEDAVQDVCLELMRRDEPVHDPEALAFRILQYRCAHFLRARAIRREVLAGDVPGFADDLASPDRRVELNALLSRAVAEATPACRRLLLAHYVEGRSLRETAEALSYASPNNVWALLDRCIRKLRAVLGANR